MRLSASTESDFESYPLMTRMRPDEPEEAAVDQTENEIEDAGIELEALLES